MKIIETTNSPSFSYPHYDYNSITDTEYWSDGRVFIKIRKTPYDFPTVLRSA